MQGPLRRDPPALRPAEPPEAELGLRRVLLQRQIEAGQAMSASSRTPSYTTSCPPSESCAYSCHSSPGSWFWGLGSRKQLFPAIWRLERRIARWISINAAERFARSYLLSCSCSRETFRPHLFKQAAQLTPHR